LTGTVLEIINPIVINACTKSLQKSSGSNQLRMSQPFTILFAPFRGIGHVNPAIGIAQQLQARGHKVVFVVERCLKGKLEPLGFHVCYLEGEDEVAVKELRIKRFEGLASILAMEPIEQIEHTHIPFYRGAIQKTKSRDAELREVMAAIKPDVIVVDLILQCPALVDQGKQPRQN